MVHAKPEEPSEDSADSKSPTRLAWLPVVLLACILPLCWLGFGTDRDTYAVLTSADSTWRLHIPQTSRNPGYWTYEAIVYGLNHLGGATACNLGSFTMACLLVWRFRTWSRWLGVGYPWVIAASLITMPGFVIAASSTTDYLWSLFCLVLGGEFILRRQWMTAALFSAMAIALRGGNAPVVGAGFLAVLWFECYEKRRFTPEGRRIAISGIASCVLACAAYYPSYRLWGNMSFTQALYEPDLYRGWLRPAKFVYKAHLTVGPIAAAVLVYAALVYCRSRRAVDPVPIPREKRASTLAAGYIFGNLAIFWIYPIKYLYLLPAAFFFLLLAGSTVLTVSRRVAVAFFLSILSFDFVFPAMFEPNIRRHSTGAAVHPALKAGLALEDGLTRTRYTGCSDFPCFSMRWTQAGEELPDQ